MFKRFELKDYIRLAMLISLTVVLGYVSGFLRFGNISKLSLGFIPVFIAAAAYGPLSGGFVGAAADFLSYIFNPTGAYLWQLTLIEFAYGFIFGLFFHKKNKEIKLYLIRLFICVLIQLAVNLTLKTFILMQAGYVPAEFLTATALRFPAVIAASVLQIVILGFSARFMPTLMRFIRS